MATLRTFAAPIEAPVDTVAGVLEARRPGVVSGGPGACGGRIETAFDPVAAVIQPGLDPVTASIEMTVDAVSDGIGIGGFGAGGKQDCGQCGYAKNRFFHVLDSLRIRPKVALTENNVRAVTWLTCAFYSHPLH